MSDDGRSFAGRRLNLSQLADTFAYTSQPATGQGYISVRQSYILDFMTKRLVEIDDELLSRARAAAGTPTIKATVETALQRLVDHDTAMRHVARLRREGALDLARLEEARRPATGRDG